MLACEPTTGHGNTGLTAGSSYIHPKGNNVSIANRVMMVRFQFSAMKVCAMRRPDVDDGNALPLLETTRERDYSQIPLFQDLLGVSHGFLT